MNSSLLECHCRHSGIEHREGITDICMSFTTVENHAYCFLCIKSRLNVLYDCWCSTQVTPVRWQNATSVSFSIANGVKQVGILSPFFISPLYSWFYGQYVLGLLLNSFQSAFTAYHSTESALLSVHDHIIKAHQTITALCLLDHSAAFDTIDHSILIHRLSSWFGLNGTVLSWLNSHISSRDFCQYQEKYIRSTTTSSRCSTRLCSRSSSFHSLHHSI